MPSWTTSLPAATNSLFVNSSVVIFDGSKPLDLGGVYSFLYSNGKLGAFWYHIIGGCTRGFVYQHLYPVTINLKPMIECDSDIKCLEVDTKYINTLLKVANTLDGLQTFIKEENRFPTPSEIITQGAI